MKPYIREGTKEEFEGLGRLMIAVYSKLEGFPKPDEQPRYYQLLADIGRFAEKKDAKVLVAVSPQAEVYNTSDAGRVGTL